MNKSKQPIDRILIFTIESFFAHGGICAYIERFHDRIAGIVLSQRYGEKHGSFLEQVIHHYRQSGFRFVYYLSFHLISYFFVIHILNLFYFITFRKKKAFTIQGLARKHKIPIYFTGDINDRDSCDFIKSIAPDIIVSSYFDQIIRSKTFSLSRLGAINIHPGALPQNRGVCPTLVANVYGYKQGVSIHQINDKIDDGDLYTVIDAVENNGKSIVSLDYLLMEAGAKRASELIEAMAAEQHPSAIPQDVNDAHYHSFPTKEEMAFLKTNKTNLYSYKDIFTHLHRTSLSTRSDR